MLTQLDKGELEGGAWKTVNGSPVYFKDGVAIAGAPWAVKSALKDPAHIAAEPKKPEYKVPKTAPGMLIDFEVFKTYSMQQAQEAQDKGKAGKTTDPVYHAYGVMWQHKVAADADPTPANISKLAASKQFYTALKGEAKSGKLGITPKAPEPKPEPAPTPKAPEPTKVEPIVSQGPISSLSGFTKEKVLGGSSKAELWKNASGEQVVVKKPLGGAAQAEVEKTTADMYRAVGIQAPEISRIGDTIVAPFVKGETLGQAIAKHGVDSEKGQEIMRQFGDGFLMDALLANWDVAGANNDNVLVDSQGKLHRVDVGGSLDKRAQGKDKPFTSHVGEFDTLVSKATTSFQREAFQAAKDSPVRLQAQMSRILDRRDAIEKAAGKHSAVVSARIDHLQSLVKGHIAGAAKKIEQEAEAKKPYAGGTNWKDVKNLMAPELAKAIPNLNGVIPNTAIAQATLRATPQFSALRSFTGHLYSDINSGQAPKQAEYAMQAVKAMEPATVSGLARGLKFGSGKYDGNTKLDAFLNGIFGGKKAEVFAAMKGTPAEKNSSNTPSNFDAVAVKLLSAGHVDELSRPLSSFSTRMGMAHGWAGGSHTSNGKTDGIEHWSSTENAHSRGVVLRMKGESTQSRDVKRISQHKSEDEHVFLKGWKFRPTRAALIGGNLHIEIEEVL